MIGSINKYWMRVGVSEIMRNWASPSRSGKRSPESRDGSLFCLGYRCTEDFFGLDLDQMFRNPSKRHVNIETVLGVSFLIS